MATSVLDGPKAVLYRWSSNRDAMVPMLKDQNSSVIFEFQSGLFLVCGLVLGAFPTKTYYLVWKGDFHFKLACFTIEGLI